MTNGTNVGPVTPAHIAMRQVAIYYMREAHIFYEKFGVSVMNVAE